MDFSNIRYKKNLINQFIARIDFIQFLSNENIFCADIEKNILHFFPRRGIAQVVQFNSIDVVVDAADPIHPQAKGETIEGMQKIYYSSDGKNRLTLSNKSIIFVVSQYNSFEEHLATIRPILLNFFSQNKQITSERTGIRYINIFDSENIKIRKNMFAPELSAMLGAKKFVDEDELQLIRAMGLNEYHISNMTLNFKYGMFNPDYPSALSKNSFSLDFDCFTNDPMGTSDEILRCIQEGHDAIQSLFESSITNTMRKVLNNE